MLLGLVYRIVLSLFKLGFIKALAGGLGSSYFRSPGPSDLFAIALLSRFLVIVYRLNIRIIGHLGTVCQGLSREYFRYLVSPLFSMT